MIPQAPDAERSILGSILISDDLIHQAAHELSCDDFFTEANRKIFFAMSSLAAEGIPIDPITLGNCLGKEFKQIGGAEYLYSLRSESIRRKNLDFHVNLLREKSNLRRLSKIASDLQGWVNDGLPIDEVLGRAKDSINLIEGQCGKEGGRHIREVMADALREMEIQSKHNGLLGLSTGIDGLDRATTGLRPGEMWVVGALPGMGKTALGIQFSGEASRNKVPTLIFELEMKDTQVARRVLANESGVDALKIRNPVCLGREDWAALTKTAGMVMDDWPLWIDDASELKLNEIYARARLYIRKYEVKLIIVDYLMLVADPSEKEMRLKARNISNTMRRIAKDFNVSVVLLSQLSRPRDKDINRRPSMIDLRESGDIEASAHVVVLLYMPLDDMGNPTGEDEIIIGKNREGPRGSEPVLFHPQRLRFLDRWRER